ncbi:endoplasmic oxidoreductin-1 [Marasmius tenuissimus]|nr:endoplasmic oxidoreductin-1 [Marasmius tenuissimus]
MTSWSGVITVIQIFAILKTPKVRSWLHCTLMLSHLCVNSGGILRSVPNTRKIHRIRGRRCTKHMAGDLPRKLLCSFISSVPLRSETRSSDLPRRASLLQSRFGTACLHLHSHMPRLLGPHDWRVGSKSSVLRFAGRVVSGAIEYIYFNTVILLRAVARLGPHLHLYDYAEGEDTTAVAAQLDSLLSIAQDAGKFDERTLFSGISAQALKEEFKAHFRNVTRIMDCIDCDQCRLWGKVQTKGVATALKVLFELDEASLSRSPNSNPLQRSEIVALFNTLHRFSESLQAVDIFRRLATDSDGDADSQPEIQKVTDTDLDSLESV